MKPLVREGGGLADEAGVFAPPRARRVMVSGATFWLYMYFLMDYFIHFSARVPAYGKARPTLLLVLIISTMLWAQWGFLKKREMSPVSRSLLILMAYFVVSLPFVAYPGSVVRGNLAEFIKAVSFFYFTAFIVDSPKRLKIFLFVFVASQVFRVLEPLAMNITSGYWGSGTYLGQGEFADRLAGSPADVVNPNGLGFVIATVIPYLHYLLFPKGFWGKALYLILLPALLYALILTMSRGAFIALVVVMVAVIRGAKHRFLLVVVIMGLAVASWSVMTPFQQDRYLSLIGKSDTTNARTSKGRITGMVHEFKLGLSRPIFGHGLGTTAETKYHALGDAHVSHNLYAEIMIETGLIGSSIFLYFMWAVYRSLSVLQVFMRSRRRGRNSFANRLLKTLTTVFWMYAVYSVNYWGLSEYYWYLFGGTVFAFHRQVVLRSSQNPVAASGSRSSAQLGP